MPHGRMPHDSRFLAPARVIGFLEFFFRRNDSSGDIYPDDDPYGFVPGPDPRRVLVLGEGNAMGLGVLHHNLGMAGHVARLLSARAHRGVHWWAMGVRGSSIKNAWESIDSHRDLLGQVDAVVLMMGVTDTLSLTSRSTWAAHLKDTLDFLRESLPRDAEILVTQIPPMDNAGSISALARVAAGRQARAFNRISARLVAGRRGVRTVPFPDALREELWVPEGRQSPYVGMYSAWSHAVVDELTRIEATTRASNMLAS